MAENPLQTQTIDRTAAVVRGVVGAVPVVGPLIAEVISGVIPGQKLQRLERWLNLFSSRVTSLENGFERLNERLRTPEGADILEDGLLEASRAVSEERLERLARLLANGLAGPDFEHDRVKTLARLFAGLTDAEIVLLTFYAKPPTFGSPWHKAMLERHPGSFDPCHARWAVLNLRLIAERSKITERRPLHGLGCFDRMAGLQASPRSAGSSFVI